jgi:RNA polymerase sigma-70 factor (ECF subfamily)
MLTFEKLPDRTTVYRVDSIIFKNAKIDAQLEKQFLLGNRSQSDSTDFWQLWGQHQDYLYQRCLTWMGGNHEDAQEALSRATIKAWEKWQDYSGKITNPKAWLIQLTRNLCMDMHRERNRGARGVESLENLAEAEQEYVASSISSPESELLCCEKDNHIRRAINALPTNVRIPFILRYDEEMSYSEIAAKLALSSEKVRKLIQQARVILRKQLNKYFSDRDNSSPLFETASAPCLDPPSAPLKKGGTIGGDFAPPLVRGVGGVCALKKSESEPTTAFDCEMPITAGCTPESINYKVTATCLEVLSHAWYSSPSCLGWR